MDSLLQEVDARTGTSIQSFGTNGVVDLRVGIDGRDPETIGPIQSNTPGEIFENLLILGSATGEGYMSPPGDIRAYDVLTGKLVWTFHTVPRPGEYGYDTWPKDAWKYVGGTNSWGEMTIDTARGIAYVPIGSPTYDFYGADRAGANLFGTSIVALDARTGRRRWHFQLVHHDLWDMDPSAAPQLTTIRQGGRNRDVVAVTAKTGWLYVFDRVTGEPIWPIEERPVPKSDHGRRAELADPARADQTRRVHQAHLHGRRHQPGPARRAGGRVADAAARGRQQRHLRADQHQGHGERAGEQWRGRSSAARRPSRAPARSTSSRTTTPASSGCCVPARAAASAVRPCRRGRSSTSRTARCATASTARAPTPERRSWTPPPIPANGIAAGAPRFDAARDSCRARHRQETACRRSRI